MCSPFQRQIIIDEPQLPTPIPIPIPITSDQNNKAMAPKYQSHGRFKKIEARLETRCQQTQGGVEYIPPPPDEATRGATAKRRRRMENKLFRFMEEDEKRHSAMARQTQERYQVIEAQLERDCTNSKDSLRYISESFMPYLTSKKYAGKGVDYVPPSPTESQTQTDIRRRRMRMLLETHWMAQKKLTKTRKLLLEIEDRVKSGLQSKHGSIVSPQMKEAFRAFKKARATNRKLTLNSNYPGKPKGKDRGLHCPCHFETCGYLTIARAILLLNGTEEGNNEGGEGLPPSWGICRSTRRDRDFVHEYRDRDCVHEYRKRLFEFVFKIITPKYPHALNENALRKLFCRFDRERPIQERIKWVEGAGPWLLPGSRLFKRDFETDEGLKIHEPLETLHRRKMEDLKELVREFT